MARQVTRRAWVGTAAILLSAFGVFRALQADEPAAQDLSIQIAPNEEWRVTVTCNCSFDLTATELSGAKKSQKASYQIFQEYDKKFLKVDKNLPVQVHHTYRSDSVTNIGAGGNPTPTSLEGAEVTITEAVAGEQPEIVVAKGSPAPAVLARLRASEDCFLIAPAGPKKQGERWKLDHAHALALALQGDAVAGCAPEGVEANFESMDGDVAVIKLSLMGRQTRNDPGQTASAEFTGEYRFNVMTRKPVMLKLKGSYKAVSRVGETPVTVDGTRGGGYDLMVKYGQK